MVWLRRLGWLVAAFHIGISLLYNIDGFQMSLSVVRADTTGQRRLFHCLRGINHALPVAAYARLTGIATGYGFYAPHVASPYVIEVIAAPDATGRGDTLVRPQWASGGGAVRYRAFTSSLRHLLPEKLRLFDTDTLAIRYTGVLARQAAHRMTGSCQARPIRWRAYVLTLPTLRSPRSTFYTLLADEPTTPTPCKRTPDSR